MKRANSKTGLANTGTNICIEKMRKYFLVCIVCAYEFSSSFITKQKIKFYKYIFYPIAAHARIPSARK